MRARDLLAGNGAADQHDLAVEASDHPAAGGRLLDLQRHQRSGRHHQRGPETRSSQMCKQRGRWQITPASSASGSNRAARTHLARASDDRQPRLTLRHVIDGKAGCVRAPADRWPCRARARRPRASCARETRPVPHPLRRRVRDARRPTGASRGRHQLAVDRAQSSEQREAPIAAHAARLRRAPHPARSPAGRATRRLRRQDARRARARQLEHHPLEMRRQRQSAMFDCRLGAAGCASRALPPSGRPRGATRRTLRGHRSHRTRPAPDGAADPCGSSARSSDRCRAARPSAARRRVAQRDDHLEGGSDDANQMAVVFLTDVMFDGAAVVGGRYSRINSRHWQAHDCVPRPCRRPCSVRSMSTC